MSVFVMVAMSMDGFPCRSALAPDAEAEVRSPHQRITCYGSARQHGRRRHPDPGRAKRLLAIARDNVNETFGHAARDEHPAITCAIRVPSSDGLTTTAFPAISAGASFWTAGWRAR